MIVYRIPLTPVEFPLLESPRPCEAPPGGRLGAWARPEKLADADSRRIAQFGGRSLPLLGFHVKVAWTGPPTEMYPPDTAVTVAAMLDGIPLATYGAL